MADPRMGLITNPLSFSETIHTEKQIFSSHRHISKPVKNTEEENRPQRRDSRIDRRWFEFSLKWCHWFTVIFLP